MLGLSCAQREGEKGRMEWEKERERVRMGSMPTVGATWTYLSCLLSFGRATLHIICFFFLFCTCVCTYPRV